MMIFLRIGCILVTLAGIIAGSDIYSRLSVSPDSLQYILFSITISSTFLAAAVLYLSIRSPQHLTRIRSFIHKRREFNYLLIVLGYLFLESVQDLLFLEANLREIHYRVYRIFLADNYSTLIFIAVFSLVGILLFAAIKNIKSKLLYYTNLDQIVVWVPVLFFSLIILLSSFTRYGIQENFQGLGVFLPVNAPLPAIHVFIVIIFSLIIWGAVFFLRKMLPGGLKHRNLDIFISVLLIAAAVLIWNQVPFAPNPLLGEAREPNLENYPISDALYYSIQADRLNVGNGFETTVEHPMYILMLAGMKRMVGSDISQIILTQICLFSLIPVLMYNIVRKMYSRYAGLLVSSLYIIKERNSIQLGEFITVSNVKMFMTESLSLLCLLALLLFLMNWIESKNKSWKYTLPAGGIFGFLTLVRVEVLAILPILFLAALPAFKTNYHKWVRGILTFLVAMLVMVSPWMIRNWQKTGLPYIDKYETSLKIVKKIEAMFRFNSPGDDELNLFLEGPAVQHYQPHYQKNARPVQQQDPESFSSPLGLAGNHFINDIQQTMLYLPSNHQPLLTIGSLIDWRDTDQEVAVNKGYFSDPYLERYVRSLPYWWTDWDGRLVSRSVLPVLATMLLISFGIRAALEKQQAFTVMLLATLLSYIVVYSLYGRSGGRTIHTVEWITLVFFGIGIAELIEKILLDISPFKDFYHSLTPRNDQVGKESQLNDSAHRQRWLLVTSLGVIFTVGLLLPLHEKLIPTRYDQTSLSEELQRVSTSYPALIAEHPPCQKGIEDGDPCLLYGRALYPGYFDAGERLVDHRQGTLPDSSYQRLEFYLTGTDNIWAAIPSAARDIPLANESEVIVIGSYQPEIMKNELERLYGNYFKVSRIIILNPIGETEIQLYNCDGPSCDLSQPRAAE